ncbi:MAG TPA: energy transducer TonB [Terriglobales bacterium]|nr:energy transducer TonB [Terriglobales bacterium]
MRLLAFSLFLALTIAPLAASGEESAFINCAGKEKKATALINVCDDSSKVQLTCGQKVAVFEDRGGWLKIRTAEGHTYFIGMSAVSYDRKRFFPVMLPDLGATNCFSNAENNAGPVPKALYAPDPEYSEEARRDKLEGTVILSLTVATDGTVHDVKVIKPLGKGLDEKAVAAVQHWRFEPVLKDGKPVETKIHTFVSFRLY